jgi:hypothetical protein
MTKAEYLRRGRALPLVELKRLANVMKYLNDFNPEGEELKGVLAGLTPAATSLLHDMLVEGVEDERKEANVPGDH